MKTPALNDLIQKTKSEIQPDSEGKKFMDADAVITFLVLHGLKILLPELKEWVKLGFLKITLWRLKIEKKLKDYALEKELDFKTAQIASQKIAQNINENNIKNIITELEQKS